MNLQFYESDKILDWSYIPCINILNFNGLVEFKSYIKWNNKYPEPTTGDKYYTIGLVIDLDYNRQLNKNSQIKLKTINYIEHKYNILNLYPIEYKEMNKYGYHREYSDNYSPFNYIIDLDGSDLKNRIIRFKEYIGKFSKAMFKYVGSIYKRSEVNNKVVIKEIRG